MPNWCNNTLSLSGNPDDITKFYMENKSDDTVDDDDIKLLDFSKSVPRPKEEEDNWYEWNCSNWGTKWNASSVSCDGNSYTFSTAWCPPTEWLLSTSEKYPNIEFELTFEEGGCDFFGIYIIQDGMKLSQYDFELSNIHNSIYEMLNEKFIELMESNFSCNEYTLKTLNNLNYLPKDLNCLIVNFTPSFTTSKQSEFTKDYINNDTILDKVLNEFKEFIDENDERMTELIDIEFYGCDPYFCLSENDEYYYTEHFKENIFDKYFNEDKLPFIDFLNIIS